MIELAERLLGFDMDALCQIVQDVFTSYNGQDVTYNELRERIVNQLMANPTTDDGTRMSDYLVSNNDGDWATYLERMHKDEKDHRCP